MLLEVHSTRLFPKNLGAGAYRLSGIASRCDWVVLSDRGEPTTLLLRRDGGRAPRHVFLSLRSPFVALAFFVREVMPLLTSPYILISGSEDVTVPHQRDLRWRPFSETETRYIRAMLDHPPLIRWFAENLDDTNDPRFSPLPVGMTFPDGAPSSGIPVPSPPPQRQRPLHILCAHRVREGPQWDIRCKVTALCRNQWEAWCTMLEEEVSEERFLELVAQHAFVICAEGGGLDPSPKAWQSILHGAIPIVRFGPLQSAYRQLPVAFVPDWEPSAITGEKLAAWHRRLAPIQDNPATRMDVVRRLGIDYWWNNICASRPQNSEP